MSEPDDDTNTTDTGSDDTDNDRDPTGSAPFLPVRDVGASTGHDGNGGGN